MEPPTSPTSAARRMVSAATAGASPKPFSRSAETGRSVASTMARPCASASSRVTLPSRRPRTPAAAPLEVASAWKPSPARMRADPASQGLGITKTPGASWSARNRAALSLWLAVMRSSLPGERVGRPARIGPGREHARLRIAAGHHRAEAAGSDLGDRVAERPELRAGALGDAWLDVELTGPVDVRIERVDEGLGREAQGLHGLLRVHSKDQQVEDELQIGLGL